MTRSLAFLVILLAPSTMTHASEMPWVVVSDDGRDFVTRPGGERFVVWGVNYDHDRQGRLLEDYWVDEWGSVVEDFGEMKDLGANTVRIHLQFGRFMNGPTKPNREALVRLGRLLKVAEESELYLDLTGLGCYHKPDVPDWYDALSEEDRWQAQARFWEAVAETCADSPAVFCYDLMNEPVVPAGESRRDDWLGPGFGDKFFVQFIGLERKGRERTDVARAWIDTLADAIRRHDTRHLITVGLVHWSLERPGLQSGFVPGKTTDRLDFIAVHIYPQKDKVDEALQTLCGFDVGKPIVIEEIFPLKAGQEQTVEFIEKSRVRADGWVSFYWGKTVEEARAAGTLSDAIFASWLDWYQDNAP